MEERQLAQIDQFIEGMGLSAQADGLPRIAGRMIGFFVIFGGPFSFSEIAERLQVSRGSVSTNARILVTLGVLEKVSHPGDRQDYYQIAHHPFIKLLRGYAERMQRVAALVDRVKHVAPDDENMNQRLTEMSNFYDRAISNAIDLAAELGED